MKICPFCAEEIQDAAIKCRYCGSGLGLPTLKASEPPPSKGYQGLCANNEQKTVSTNSYVQNARINAPFPTNHLGMQPGFWRRTGAYIIDSIIINIFGFFIALIVSALSNSDASYVAGDLGGASLASKLLLLITALIYGGIMESSQFQATFGKMCLGIYVASESTGERVHFIQAFGRNFYMLFSAVILGIGFLMCIWTKKKQCLHDIMSYCVIYDKSVRPLRS